MCLKKKGFLSVEFYPKAAFAFPSDRLCLVEPKVFISIIHGFFSVTEVYTGN
jgi:hypothetical protein